MRGTWGWQCLQDARGKARAGVPNLDCDQPMRGSVVVAEAAWDPLTDDIVGLPGWEPSDIGVCVVVGKPHDRMLSEWIALEDRLRGHRTFAQVEWIEISLLRQSF